MKKELDRFLDCTIKAGALTNLPEQLRKKLYGLSINENAQENLVTDESFSPFTSAQSNLKLANTEEEFNPELKEKLENILELLDRINFGFERRIIEDKSINEKAEIDKSSFIINLIANYGDRLMITIQLIGPEDLKLTQNIILISLDQKLKDVRFTSAGSQKKFVNTDMKNFDSEENDFERVKQEIELIIKALNFLAEKN